MTVYVCAWVCVGRSQTLPQEIQMENGLFLMKTFMDKTNFQGRNVYLLPANSDMNVCTEAIGGKRTWFKTALTG